MDGRRCLFFFFGGGGGGGDNFNLVLFISHCNLFPLFFQDPFISSFKGRNVIEGFSMVWDWGKREIIWLCSPKEFGGLGLGKTSLRNRAFLGKLLCMFPKESGSLWHKVILSIYETHFNGWDANIMIRCHIDVR